MAAVLVFGLATLPFAWVLDLPFTGIDTLPTLAAARVDEPSDWLALLHSELRGGRGEGGVPYYRPVTLFTHAIDRTLWGWDAFGHHAMDLLFHGLFALGAWAVARWAFDRGPREALLAAMLFALHPTAIEVVPAISRRSEALLGIGTCLMLLAARRLPAPRSRYLTLVGVAFGAAVIERGLVLPAVLASYLFFWRLRDQTWGERLARTAAWVWPSALLVMFFFAIHLLVVSGSAVQFSPANLRSIPPRFLHWLIYPQQTLDLHAPDTVVETVGLAVLALGLGTLVGLALLRPERRGLHLAALGWIGAVALPPTVGGQMNSWYPYTAGVPLGLIVASLITQGVEARARSPVAIAAAGVATIYALLAVVIPSPVFRDYPAWNAAGAHTAALNRAVLELARSAPDGDVPVLVNVPSHLRESDGDFLITRSAAIHWPYSLRAWLRENGIERPVSVLGTSLQVGAFAVPRMSLAEPSRVRILFPPGSPTRYVDASRPRRDGRPLETTVGDGYEFAWPPAEAMDRRPVIWMFVGDRFESVSLR